MIMGIGERGMTRPNPIAFDPDPFCESYSIDLHA